MRPRKVTAEAPANLALVKYWGARDLDRGIPNHPSLSITLSRCRSRCTVEPRDGDEDVVLRFDAEGGGRPASEDFARPVLRHVTRLRRAAGHGAAVRVATRNNFPTGAGLASSASGFAALTLAVARAFGVELGPEERSVWARRSGSGSAARSTLGGYVEWPGGAGAEMEGPARQLAPPGHWDLRDVVALVDAGEKEVSSRAGHERAASSPHYRRRLELVPGRVEEVREAVRSRQLSRLGPVAETEAVEMHLVAMSSRPPIYYWSPGTLEVMRAVRGLRSEGRAEAYFSIDAGPNVHVICRPAEADTVADRLRELPSVQEVLRDGVGGGPRYLDEHLL